MKTSKARAGFYQARINFFARGVWVICLTLLCFRADLAQAQTDTNYLDRWSFNDPSGWPSDRGDAPVSFANISESWLGDGTAVVVDSTNAAWLQYPVTESNSTNHLKVDRGSVMLWFAPHWTGTNEGGTGPGTWGRLLEAGSVNSNGWWSLYVDPEGANLYFSAQTNGGAPFTYLSAPIDWPITNRWHQLVLNYSATNTALYVDDTLVSSGPGVTNFPGADVRASGFFIGSDRTGNSQAHGMFDDVYTYSHLLSYGNMTAEFLTGMLYFLLNPLNAANFSPASTAPPSTPSVISGTGALQWLGMDGSCTTGTNVWIKNMSAVLAGNGTVDVIFTITGGTAGGRYDAFATAALASPVTNADWAWLGQGVNCGSYGLNLANSEAFLILGTALDSDEDGLTDAYERLVSHTDPYNPDSDGDGWTDGEEILNGTDPNVVDQPFKVFISRPKANSVIP